MRIITEMSDNNDLAKMSDLNNLTVILNHSLENCPTDLTCLGKNNYQGYFQKTLDAMSTSVLLSSGSFCDGLSLVAVFSYGEIGGYWECIRIEAFDRLSCCLLCQTKIERTNETMLKINSFTLSSEPATSPKALNHYHSFSMKLPRSRLGISSPSWPQFLRCRYTYISGMLCFFLF